MILADNRSIVQKNTHTQIFTIQGIEQLMQITKTCAEMQENQPVN